MILYRWTDLATGIREAVATLWKMPAAGAGGTQWQVLHSWFQILYCTIIPIKTYHRYTVTNLCQQALLCLPDCKMMQRGFSQASLGTLRCYSHAIWGAPVTLGYAILGDSLEPGWGIFLLILAQCNMFGFLVFVVSYLSSIFLFWFLQFWSFLRDLSQNEPKYCYPSNPVEVIGPVLLKWKTY